MTKAMRGTILLNALENRLQLEPARMAYSFLSQDGRDAQSISYAALARRARAVAARLQDQGLEGRTAILLYGAGLDFLVAFWGCVSANVIAVPTAVPASRRKASAFLRLCDDAKPGAILTTGALAASHRSWFQDQPIGALPWLATDQVEEEWAEHWIRPEVDPTTPAYLQYTSGSTSQPRGVIVNHENVLANIGYIRDGLGMDTSSVMVSWLPHFHDMGLVSACLLPACVGLPSYLMAPVSFVQSPIRWLRTITMYRGTHSGGPDFAFRLCVDRTDPAQREELDLSSWRSAYNGAEPVKPSTLRDFSNTFGPFGFRPSAHRPSYGLAEATLMVTAHGGDRPYSLLVARHALQNGRIHVRAPGDEDTIELVPCGAPPAGTKVRIVAPESGSLCPADEVGEIWVSSASTSRGYWGTEETRAAKFSARVRSDDQTYLRTGDLGFLNDGQLYITGRLDDLIIVRGRNHYPQDIESTVERSHPWLEPSACAVFTCEIDGQQRLVVAQEIRRAYWRKASFEDCIKSIRENVSAEHELSIAVVVLLRPASIPKTSSGKIQRGKCRELFRTDSLLALATDACSPVDEIHVEDTPTRSYVVDRESLRVWVVQWSRQHPELNTNALAGGATFAEAGFDSMHNLELTGALSDHIGYPLSERLPFDFPTLDALAEHLAAGPPMPQEPDA